MKEKRITRRNFIKHLATAAGATLLLPLGKYLTPGKNTTNKKSTHEAMHYKTNNKLAG